jgi:hypothetical protein
LVLAALQIIRVQTLFFLLSHQLVVVGLLVLAMV